MINTIITIIGIAVVGNMAAHWFLPIQGVKSKLISILSFSNFLYTYANKLLNCSKCMSFWLAISYFSLISVISVPDMIIYSALCSYIGYLINTSINFIEAQYE